MKRHWILCFFALVMLFFVPIRVGAALDRTIPQERLHKILEIIEGDWYDNDGNIVLSIHDGYINQCEVTEGYNLVGSPGSGSAIFCLQESDGLRDLRLNWFMDGDGSFIKLNQGDALHRTADAYFYESVGGLHLGMTMDEVLELCGEGKELAPKELFIDGAPNRLRWYYPQQKIVLWFDGSNVCQISLLQDSTLRLEKSGLNCQNTPEEFARAYAMKKVPKLPKKSAMEAPHTGIRAYSIGHGEFLYFGHNMEFVGLSIFGY